MKLMIWISILLGRRFGRLLLYPICTYFYLLTPDARRASRNYLHRILGHEPTSREVFRHFYYFASTLLDRAFLLTGRNRILVINKYGLDGLREVLEKYGVCLFLGAHVGSFELLRYGGARRWGMPINVMMYEENARKMKSVMESFRGGVKLNMLPIGDFSSLMEAQRRMRNGEALAILGDRAIGNEKMVEVNFLGGRARLPAGPLMAASALKIPVVLVFGLYRGGNRYEVYFEPFANEIELNRKTRQQDLQKWLQCYADRVEHYCRIDPFNWFNFYNFWSETREGNDRIDTSSEALSQ